MSNHGHISLGIRQIPIVDCTSWCVNRLTKQPVCVLNLDLNRCGECEHRESRNGNLSDPPIVVPASNLPTIASSDSVQAQPVQEGVPSPATNVEAKRAGWRGLGDMIAAATSAVGIKPCGGCRARQQMLNRVVPFKRSANDQELLGNPDE
jgi:hypothetical protein